MAKVNIPCLVGRTNKAKVTSWYWQPSKTLRDAGWEPLALGKDEGAAIAAARARNAEVERWKLGDHRPQTVKRHAATGTLSALIKRYRREVLEGTKPDGSRRIARSTARTYSSSLKHLEEWGGKHPLPYITRSRVRVLRDNALKGLGEHATHQMLKMGRQLFACAIDWELVEQGKNPFEKFGMAQPAPRGVIWSPPARELMVQTAYDCGMPSVALAIMLGFAIGQREGDLLALTQRQYVAIPEHKMQPEDFATLAAIAPDGVPRGIRVRQQKTKAWVEVPIVGLVRWAVESNIETARAGAATTILLDDTRGSTKRAALYAGEAGQTRFQRDFAKVREWAIATALFEGDDVLAEELGTVKFHDLRRTCVVYLGELGLEDHLIAAITGHDIDETRRILRTYMPRTTGRAARAIALAAARQAKEAERAEEKKA